MADNDPLNFAPGDIIVDYFILTGSGGGGDITPRLIEFKMFENLKNPYTILTAELMDCHDILNTFPGLDGTETVTISFHQPGQRPYQGTFILTEVKKAKYLENQRTAIYNIQCYSPHMNNLPIVIKSFKNVTGTDAISSLVGEYLHPIKPFVVQDSSSGLIGNDQHPYIVHGVQIFKAIKQIMTRLKSSSNDSSVWFFFENQYALILDTIESLFAKASATATYYERPLGHEFLNDQLKQEFTIIDIEENSRVNTTEQIQGLNQTVGHFDTFSLKYATQNILGGGFKGLGSTPIGKGLQSGAPSIRNFIPKNKIAPPTNIENFIAPRKSAAGILDSQSVTALVPFNSDLTVGLGVDVQTLAPAGDTDTPVLDKIAGLVLMVEVCHTVNTRQKKMAGTTTFKALKSGFDY